MVVHCGHDHCPTVAASGMLHVQPPLDQEIGISLSIFAFQGGIGLLCGQHLASKPVFNRVRRKIVYIYIYIYEFIYVYIYI